MQIDDGRKKSQNGQAAGTHEVLEILETYIRNQLEAEAYADSVLNLRVEFAAAGSSSLDLVVIADFEAYK